MDIMEIIKVIILGIVEGITEWLPISSTGHLILMNTFMPLRPYADAAGNEAFWQLYSVFIQLGSVLAVLILFIRRLNPFSARLSEKGRNSVLRLWIKIIIASVPAGIAGVLLDDWIDAKMQSVYVIAAALIIYGILFILIEKKERPVTVKTTRQVSYKNALMTGLCQVLALIPGTSRSGVTILGASMQGFSRAAAAEFSFCMAIPVMFGAGILKLFKIHIAWNAGAVCILLAGMISAFAVSVLVIRQMLAYIRTHDFTLFGYYRIVLGIMILIFAMLKWVA